MSWEREEGRGASKVNIFAGSILEFYEFLEERSQMTGAQNMNLYIFGDDFDSLFSARIIM